MNKSTKVNLTIFFSLNRKNFNLENVFESILKQTDKDFNIVFVINNAPIADRELLSKTNFSEMNNVSYMLMSESLGDSFTFNYCIGKTQTKYAVFLDSNFLLKPDFVSTINQFLKHHKDTDVLSFFSVPNYYFKEEAIEIKKMSDDFCKRPLLVFTAKVVNVEFIKKNAITKPLFIFNPITFYMQLATHKPHWYSLGRQICSFSNKFIYWYNIFDLYSECENLLDYLNDKQYKNCADEIEYLILIGLLRNFLFAYFSSNYTNLFSLRKILKRIDNFLKVNIPNWRKNPWLWSKQNTNDNDYLNYMRDFKPKIRYVKKEIRSSSYKKRVSGNENTK